MAHTVRDKTKLLNRIKRILGQAQAVRQALEDERDCTEVMQLVAACHGALNALMAELVEGHVRYHMVDPDRRPTTAEARAAQELIDVVRSYVR
jgi:FrmR/RcnR family transcriptional regulator, repressor of frmRAB operon